MDKVKQARQFRRLAKQMRGHAEKTETARGEHHSLGTARTFDEIADSFERIDSKDGARKEARRGNRREGK
jgi:hypothetical protein